MEAMIFFGVGIISGFLAGYYWPRVEADVAMLKADVAELRAKLEGK